MKKKLLGLIVAFAIVALAVGMSVAFPIYASAETGDITYLAPVYDAQGNVTFDNNGEVVMQTKTISEEAYTVVTKQTKVLGKNDSAAAPDENGEYWYVVNSTVASDNNGLTITGKVNLILCDGASASYQFDTISVTEGNELTIYGQENGTGILNCNTSNSSGAVGAGIGGEGICLILPSDKADAAMEIYNQDGSNDLITEDNSVDTYMFWELDKLETLILPKSATKIMESAFENCTKLSEIKFPNNISAINDRAFANCKKLRSIELSGNITTIGESAFEGCSAIDSVVINKAYVKIGNSAFKGCSRMQYAKLGDNVESIGEQAFAYCTGLKGINAEKFLMSKE